MFPTNPYSGSSRGTRMTSQQVRDNIHRLAIAAQGEAPRQRHMPARPAPSESMVYPAAYPPTTEMLMLMPGQSRQGQMQPPPASGYGGSYGGYAGHSAYEPTSSYGASPSAFPGFPPPSSDGRSAAGYGSRRGSSARIIGLPPAPSPPGSDGRSTVGYGSRRSSSSRAPGIPPSSDGRSSARYGFRAESYYGPPPSDCGSTIRPDSSDEESDSGRPGPRSSSGNSFTAPGYPHIPRFQGGSRR